MKKALLSITLFVGASAFTIVGDPAKDIVGKWKIVEGSYNTARKLMIERTKKVNPEAAEQMEVAGEELNQIFTMLEFAYTADGKYEFITPQGPQGGTWVISNDGKYLERTNSKGIVRKDSIVEITPKTMKLMDVEYRETLGYEKSE